MGEIFILKKDFIKAITFLKIYMRMEKRISIYFILAILYIWRINNELFTKTPGKWDLYVF